MKKILFKIIVILCILCANCSVIFAEDKKEDEKPTSVIKEDAKTGLGTFTTPTDKNGFNNLGNQGNAGDAAKATQNIMGTIIQTMKVVGYGIAIIMLIYVAIKYMSAAPSEKAEFKKSATAYVVGAVVLFGAASIIGIIQNFAEKNIK